MSHPNSARILEFLGFAPDKDFYCVGNAAAVQITWLSQQTQPTDAEIDAAAAAAQAAFQDKADDYARRDQAKAAYDALETNRAEAQSSIDLIDGLGAGNMSQAQLKTALKQLFQHERQTMLALQHVIRAEFGR